MKAERKLSRLTLTALAIFVTLFAAYTAIADEATYLRMYSDCTLQDGVAVNIEIEMLTSAKDLPTAPEFREYIQRMCSHYEYDEVNKLVLHLHTFTANRLQLPSSSVITNVIVGK